MSARALAVGETPPPNLRPFDIRRDLLAVADLVELCFQDSLDADGRLYIRQMRRTARSGRMLNLAAAAAGGMDSPPGGFVWVEGEKLVGNLSLIPVHAQGFTRYLIANVAVDPKFRRRGIARALTLAAIKRAQRSRAREIWLQVDESNLAAQKLYLSMDFQQRAHRTSWQARPQLGDPQKTTEAVSIRLQKREDWGKHREWLDELYPKLIRWNLPIKIKHFQPGWRGSVQRFLGDRKSYQWAAHAGEELLALLTWQSSSMQSDRLWLATSAENEEKAVPALLAHALRKLRTNRSFVLNYPAGRAESIMESAGFFPMRSLIWMQLKKA